MTPHGRFYPLGCDATKPSLVQDKCFWTTVSGEVGERVLPAMNSVTYSTTTAPVDA